MEVKMRRNRFGILFFRGMLYRAEIVNFKVLRDYYDAAGMLTRRAARSDASLSQTLFFGFRKIQAVFFGIMHNKSVSGLFLNISDGPGSESMAFAEHRFREFMRHGLIFAGEVQIDIGCFIAFESEECFKRYFVTVAAQRCSADRAVLFGKVHSAFGFAVRRRKFAVFAVRASVMGGQRVHFRNSCKICHKR